MFDLTAMAVSCFLSPSAVAEAIAETDLPTDDTLKLANTGSPNTSAVPELLRNAHFSLSFQKKFPQWLFISAGEDSVPKFHSSPRFYTHGCAPVCVGDKAE